MHSACKVYQLYSPLKANFMPPSSSSKTPTYIHTCIVMNFHLPSSYSVPIMPMALTKEGTSLPYHATGAYWDGLASQTAFTCAIMCICIIAFQCVLRDPIECRVTFLLHSFVQSTAAMPWTSVYVVQWCFLCTNHHSMLHEWSKSRTSGT